MIQGKLPDKLKIRMNYYRVLKDGSMKRKEWSWYLTYLFRIDEMARQIPMPKGG